MLLNVTSTALTAADWPMWRFDAGHTASSPHDLPEHLELSWQRKFSQRVQAWDDPLNNDLMQYDKIFEPVVYKNIMYLSFNDRDKVLALDASTGKQRWQFFCEGPVRFPPVLAADKLYVASDDGFLYCLNADDGSQIWKFAAAPGPRKIIGNKRIISTWPVRGAPVIRDGVVYCAASIWPFMGTYFYALDAETGNVHWQNDGMGAQYAKQPHGAPSFAGVAPQGILSVTKDYVIVPGGRSVPAVFDRATGEQLYFRIADGDTQKGTGGSFVIANEKEFFVHTRHRQVRSAKLSTGKAGSKRFQEPVLSGDIVYTYIAEHDSKGVLTRSQVVALGNGVEQLWSLDLDASGDLIRAGDRLYVAGGGLLSAVKLPVAQVIEWAVTRGSMWQYMTQTDPKATWKYTLSSEWETAASGFGYGDDDDAMILSSMKGQYARVYIRKLAQIFKVKDVETLKFYVDYDDAFIAYVNGTEVLRVGVAQGSGKDAQGISSHEAGTHEVFVVKIPAGLLREGKNVIAIEGHNTSAGSSDFSLDPYVTIHRRGDLKNVAPTIMWQMPIAADVQRLLAASNTLFTVSLNGSIQAYAQKAASASSSSSVSVVVQEEPVHALPSLAARPQLKEFLKSAQLGTAHCLLFGVGGLGAGDPGAQDADAIGSVLQTLLSESKMFIDLIESDKKQVDRLRSLLDRAGLYGKRVVIHHATTAAFQGPQYAAQLVIVDPSMASEMAATMDESTLRQVYASVRPYGGILLLPQTATLKKLVSDIDSQLESAVIDSEALILEGSMVVRRVGALPGSADWTHAYGDVANTVKSDDQRVKLPLGVLWFGGSSNLDVLPRHGHGPSEQVVAGRMFIEGMDSISVRDVYTGQVLWKRIFKNLGNAGVYFDKTYKDTPLSTQYNQVHIPGATGRGTNYIATSDRLYVLEGRRCLVINPRDGSDLFQIELDEADGEWGYIGVYEKYLIAGVGFANYNQRQNSAKARLNSHQKTLDKSSSMKLFIFDRLSGEKIWQQDARFGFSHNGIVAGNNKIFCLDRYPSTYEKLMSRRGKEYSRAYRIVAFDIDSGKELWERKDYVFGSWLSYSIEHDILMQAGASGSDRLHSEVRKGMQCIRGETGSELWRNESLGYTGPCIIHNETIITTTNSYKVSSGAYSLFDGSPQYITNPITGVREQWNISRAYGCNTVIASENLLTFRSGAAGFYDLNTKTGTGNFGGFKSSCTSNLVVANGVLNAPDYTRTCSCNYQNQTSLALVHMPEVEIWTSSRYGLGKDLSSKVPLTDAHPIQKIGLNFGAPGDHMAEDGVLWLDYPSVGGATPPIAIELSGEYVTQRRQARSLGDDAYNWVSASGLRGLRSLRVQLGKGKRMYRIRLFFKDLSQSSQSIQNVQTESIFHVDLQGQRILTDCNPALLSPQKTVAYVHTVDVQIDGALHLDFTPVRGEAILNGIEIIDLQRQPQFIVYSERQEYFQAGKPLHIRQVAVDGDLPFQRSSDIIGQVFVKSDINAEPVAIPLLRNQNGMSAMIPSTVTAGPFLMRIEVTENTGIVASFPEGDAWELMKPDMQAPEKIKEFQVMDAKSYRSRITWLASTDDTAIAHYEIYELASETDQLDASNIIAKIFSKDGQKEYTYTHNVKSMTDYIYAIRAVDLSGRIGTVRFLHHRSPANTAPVAPDFAGRAFLGQVQLQWAAPAEDAIAVHVLRSPVAEGPFKIIRTIDNMRIKGVAITDVAAVMTWYAIQVEDSEGMKSKVSQVIPLLATALPAQPDVYLSDIERIAERAGAWGGLPKNDTSITERMLSIRGLQFAKGIGMHAPSFISVQRDPQWKRFTTVIGIDDKAGKKGSVRFIITGDGKELYKSVPVTRAMDGIPVDLAIPDTVTKLTFTLTDGGDKVNSDHGNWGQAGFVIE